MDNLKEDKKIEIRKRAIKKWTSDPYNLILVGILIFAFVVRIYYFAQTTQQPLWWDEGEYGAIAQKIIGVVQVYDINPQRPFLFSFLWGALIFLGLSSVIIKFLLIFMPSVGLVFCIYLLGKEMYDKKVGLIAAFFASVSWTFLFWTNRYQPDFISMCFQVLAIFYMWKFWKNNETRFVVYSGLFSALGVMFKISGLLVPLIFIVFILIKDRFSAFKNKYYYYYSASFLAFMIPQFVWSFFIFGDPTAVKTGYTNIFTGLPIGWSNLDFYYLLTEGLFFILFIIGVFYSLRFLLYSDLLIKDKKKCFDSNLYSVLTLVFISAFYIFDIRSTEDRWVFLWMPFIFFIVGSLLVAIYNSLRKNFGKMMGIIFVVLILGYIGYAQINHAGPLIDIKKDSYGPVKDAALWMKQNSNSNDLILSISYTQTSYYSQRNVKSYSLIENGSEFASYMLKNRPKYITVSIFERHPNWMFYQTNNGQYSAWVFPYFNSSIVFSSNDGKLISLDMKPEVSVEGIKYKLVYPDKNLNGAFVYQAEYES